MKTNNIIDLENYRTQLGSVKSRVFTGRDRGEDVRKRSNVNKIFDDNDIVVVKSPAMCILLLLHSWNNSFMM